MPTRLKRYHESQQSHFVTFSCYHRLPLLNSPEIRTLFVRKLETRIRFQLLVYGFVVMPEHVHLTISEPDRATLAKAVLSLKLAVSLQSKSLRGLQSQNSRFRQTRYYDFNVKTYEQFLEKLRYIHRNPVKRELRDRPEDWSWSSFRHYAMGAEVGVGIESEQTARGRVRTLSEPAPRSPKVGGHGAPS